MESDTSPIIIGIITGLCATAIWLILLKIWDKIILPWYENVLYKDIEIAGKWGASCDMHYTYEEEDDESGEIEDINVISTNKYIVTIKRAGHDVNGELIGFEGGDKGKAYKFNGVFRNLLLTANYEPESASSLDRGTISLMLINNGDLFKGVMAIYEDVSHSVKPVYVSMVRENP